MTQTTGRTGPDATAPGQARSAGPTVQSLLAEDTREVPAPLREESYEFLGSADIDKERYYSAEFHRSGAGFTRDFSALRARGFAFPRSWDACAARDYARKMSDYFYFFAALRAHYFTFRRSGDACAARGSTASARGLPLIFLPCGHEGSPSGEVGTPARRAARRGRLWGFAPFAAPLASPPKHPLRAFSISAG